MARHPDPESPKKKLRVGAKRKGEEKKKKKDKEDKEDKESKKDKESKNKKKAAATTA